MENTIMTNLLRNQKQRCGIELEMYICNTIKDKSHDSGYRGNLAAVRHAKDYLKETGKKGLSTVHDLSLRSNGIYTGAEIKFARPNMLKSAVKKIKDMESMVKDLSAFFMETEGEYCGPDEKTDMVISKDGNYNGSTGLHIHLEMPRQGYSAIDIIRLVAIHAENYEHICKLAWRKDSTRWAKSAKEEYLDSITAPRHLENLSNKYNLNKYTGLNLKNAYSSGSKRTIEFRYAHGSLASDSNAMIEYIAYLKKLYDEAFTGEPTTVFKGWLIKEVQVNRNGDSVIHAYDNAEGQGTPYVFRMCTNMKTW